MEKVASFDKLRMIKAVEQMAKISYVTLQRTMLRSAVEQYSAIVYTGFRTKPAMFAA
jgi:hypothetical protein